jgi:hypothetical protein
MFSLSISFGPTGTVWDLLFKDADKAHEMEARFFPEGIRKAREENPNSANPSVYVTDDFGQSANIPVDSFNGSMLEDLDLIEAARIQRSLADERCKAKFLQAARSDSTIRAGMGNQMPIMQPMGGFPRN